MITKVEDEGVFKEAILFQCIDDAPYETVHPLYTGVVLGVCVVE